MENVTNQENVKQNDEDIHEKTPVKERKKKCFLCRKTFWLFAGCLSLFNNLVYFDEICGDALK